MKPFNLDEALAGKKVISDFQDMHAANFTKLNSTDGCFSAMIGGPPCIFIEKAERVCRPGDMKISLVMDPTTKTLYANVYCSPTSGMCV